MENEPQKAKDRSSVIAQYQQDPKFNRLVNGLEMLLAEGEFLTFEIIQAAELAVSNHDLRSVSRAAVNYYSNLPHGNSTIPDGKRNN